jgi:hypothetical protein
MARMHNTRSRPRLCKKKENVLASASQDGGAPRVHMPSFWFRSTFRPSQFGQQHKSRIVLMQVATCHTHHVESGLDSLRPSLCLKRVPTSKRVRALDLGSTSRSSRSFYSDDAASQIENSDRGFGRPSRSGDVSQLRERLLRADGQSSRSARSHHPRRPRGDDLGR